MKKLVPFFILAIVVFACSNDGTKSASSSDSANTTTVETPVTTPSENTATNTTPTTGGANLMDLMNKNMQEMKAMQSSGNPDNDFASMMKTHHLAAIEMAQVEVAQGSDAQLKQMAQKMIDDQQKDVAEFNQFLSGHNAHSGGDAFHKEVMAKMNGMSMDMDMSGSIDKQFAQMMASHHQGAIDMSNAYLKTGAHEAKMKEMANNIKATNQKEKEDLQAWLAKNK